MTSAAAATPNAKAEQLTGRDYISYSAISTYRQCPLRYYFRYIAGIPEETVAASLVFGSAIHRAVKFHFRELLSGNPAPTLDTLLAEYQSAWRDRDEQQVLFGKEEDQESLEDLAERMLGAFQASDFANPAGNIIGVEEELRESVIPGLPDLLISSICWSTRRNHWL